MCMWSLRDLTPAIYKIFGINGKTIQYVSLCIVHAYCTVYILTNNSPFLRDTVFLTSHSEHSDFEATSNDDIPYLRPPRPACSPPAPSPASWRRRRQRRPCSEKRGWRTPSSWPAPPPSYPPPPSASLPPPSPPLSSLLLLPGNI